MNIQKWANTLIVMMIFSICGCSKILEGDFAKKLTMANGTTQNANFMSLQRITAYLLPENLELYRFLLPEQFDIPKHPLVFVGFVDNIEVGPWPLTPYQLAYINLRCSYMGEEGWYCLTMPENKWIPVLGGRTIGFNKYVADSVTLVKSDSGWKGEVIYEGSQRLLMEFSPADIEEPVWLKEKWALDGPNFNLRPPSKGPKVEIVRFIFDKEKKPNSVIINGSIRVTIGEAEPSAGLIKQGTLVYGTYSKMDNLGMHIRTDQ